MRDVLASKAVEDCANVDESLNLVPPEGTPNEPTKKLRKNCPAVGPEQNEVLTKRTMQPVGYVCCLPRAASSYYDHVMRLGSCLPCPIGKILWRDQAHFAQIQ